MKKFRLFTTVALVLSIFFTTFGCENKKNETLELTVREFNKYGNVVLETTFDDLKNINIEPADIITVTVGDDTYDIPVGTEYSNVDSGDMICRFDIKDEKVVLAVNGGNFAETANMASKEKIDEDPGYKWDIKIDTVSLCLKEKNGYRDQYTVRNLEISTSREDYPLLSDDEFANCRAFLTNKTDLLYRGTTPLDESYGRNEYTMKFISSNCIKTIINLSDTKQETESSAAYSGSYYSTCNILNCAMDYQFASDDFKEKIALAIRYIIDNDGPYFIHCIEGKDRTGIFCALLECYLGADYDEIKDDYMKTYLNFYHVEENSETYQIILKTNFNKVLCEILDIDDLKTADLKKAAEDYYLSIGLTEQDLCSLSNKVLKDSSK